MRLLPAEESERSRFVRDASGRLSGRGRGWDFELFLASTGSKRSDKVQINSHWRYQKDSHFLNRIRGNFGSPLTFNALGTKLQHIIEFSYFPLRAQVPVLEPPV